MVWWHVNLLVLIVENQHSNNTHSVYVFNFVSDVLDEVIVGHLLQAAFSYINRRDTDISIVGIMYFDQKF